MSSSSPENPRNIGEEQQVIAGTGARVETAIPAECETHVTACPLRVGDGVDTVHGEGAAGGGEQGRAHLHGGCFARAVGAEEGVDLAGANAKRDPVDGGKSVFTFAKDAAELRGIKNKRHGR